MKGFNERLFKLLNMSSGSDSDSFDEDELFCYLADSKTVNPTSTTKSDEHPALELETRDMEDKGQGSSRNITDIQISNKIGRKIAKYRNRCKIEKSTQMYEVDCLEHKKSHIGYEGSSEKGNVLMRELHGTGNKDICVHSSCKSTENHTEAHENERNYQAEGGAFLEKKNVTQVGKDVDSLFVGNGLLNKDISMYHSATQCDDLSCYEADYCEASSKSTFMLEAQDEYESIVKQDGQICSNEPMQYNLSTGVISRNTDSSDKNSSNSRYVMLSENDFHKLCALKSVDLPENMTLENVSKHFISPDSSPVKGSKVYCKSEVDKTILTGSKLLLSHMERGNTCPDMIGKEIHNEAPIDTNTVYACKNRKSVSVESKMDKSTTSEIKHEPDMSEVEIVFVKLFEDKSDHVETSLNNLHSANRPCMSVNHIPSESATEMTFSQKVSHAQCTCQSCCAKSGIAVNSTVSLMASCSAQAFHTSATPHSVDDASIASILSATTIHSVLSKDDVYPTTLSLLPNRAFDITQSSHSCRETNVSPVYNKKADENTSQNKFEGDNKSVLENISNQTADKIGHMCMDRLASNKLNVELIEEDCENDDKKKMQLDVNDQIETNPVNSGKSQGQIRFERNNDKLTRIVNIQGKETRTGIGNNPISSECIVLRVDESGQLVQCTDSERSTDKADIYTRLKPFVLHTTNTKNIQRQGEMLSKNKNDKDNFELGKCENMYGCSNYEECITGKMEIRVNDGIDSSVQKSISNISHKRDQEMKSVSSECMGFQAGCSNECKSESVVLGKTEYPGKPIEVELNNMQRSSRQSLSAESEDVDVEQINPSQGKQTVLSLKMTDEDNIIYAKSSDEHVNCVDHYSKEKQINVEENLTTKLVNNIKSNVQENEESFNETCTMKSHSDQEIMESTVSMKKEEINLTEGKKPSAGTLEKAVTVGAFGNAVKDQSCRRVQSKSLRNRTIKPGSMISENSIKDVQVLKQNRRMKKNTKECKQRALKNTNIGVKRKLDGSSKTNTRSSKRRKSQAPSPQKNGISPTTVPQKAVKKTMSSQGKLKKECDPKRQTIIVKKENHASLSMINVKNAQKNVKPIQTGQVRKSSRKRKSNVDAQNTPKSSKEKSTRNGLDKADISVAVKNADMQFIQSDFLSIATVASKTSSLKNSSKLKASNDIKLDQKSKHKEHRLKSKHKEHKLKTKVKVRMKHHPAMLKSYDTKWKELVSDKVFEIESTENRKPVNVKKLIREILSPESKEKKHREEKSRAKQRQEKKTIHKRNVKDQNASHGDVTVEPKLTSDSDDAWLSDSSSPSSFPAFKFCDQTTNASTNQAMINPGHHTISSSVPNRIKSPCKQTPSDIQSKPPCDSRVSATNRPRVSFNESVTKVGLSSPKVRHSPLKGNNQISSISTEFKSETEISADIKSAADYKHTSSTLKIPGNLQASIDQLRAMLKRNRSTDTVA